MRLSSPTVRGATSSEVVTRIFQRHLNELRFCYEQGLARDPSLAGRVVVRLTVVQDGTASNAAISGTTLGDAAVEACVARFAGRFVFPASPGIAIVDVPVIFAH